uniref:Uncharacterized protein n=1 Tax=Avena sativa TaxID=4498 RepID=A0ACD6A2Z7_AVESA
MIYGVPWYRKPTRRSVDASSKDLEKAAPFSTCIPWPQSRRLGKEKNQVRTAPCGEPRRRVLRQARPCNSSVSGGRGGEWRVETMDFPLDPVSSTAVYEGALGNGMGGGAAADEGSSQAGSVAPDRSVIGIVEAMGVSYRDGDGLADSAQCEEKKKTTSSDWRERMRSDRAPPERTLCPSRQSALEKSIRGYAEKLGDEVIDPCLGTCFDSLCEAYDFYNLYSWEHGFGICYGKSRLNAGKMKCMQEIVCGCSGKPKAENTKSFRCKCPTIIRLLKSDDNGWYITEHRVKHNHTMTETCGEKAFWPSHKHIDMYTKELVRRLRDNNINIGKVYSIISAFFEARAMFLSQRGR